MKDGIIIQARTGSTRLPSKILKPFDGQKRILDIILDNICRSCPDKKIVVATTLNPNDDVICEIAKEAGVAYYRGSEDDVLERFIAAAHKYDIDRLIRVCSDNPFLQTDSFNELFKAQELSGADYTAFAFPDGRPTIKSHLGLYGELATTAALERAAAATDEKLYREHVTIYLYTHPDKFNVELLPLPEILSQRLDLRLTLDTPEDFALLKELYGIYRQGERQTLDALLTLVDSKPEYGAIMHQNIIKNEK